jgi:cytochrome c553
MLEQHPFLKWTTLVVISSFSIILNVSQVSSGATTMDAAMSRADKMKLINLNTKNTYNHYCVHCHGEEGKGDGRSFPYELEPKPRDFTDTRYMAKLKDDAIKQVIIGGTVSIDKSNLCPAWGETFDEEQIKGLVAYVKAFSAPPPKKKEPAKAEGEAVVEGEAVAVAEGEVAAEGEAVAAAPAAEETMDEGVGVTPFIVWPILTLLSAFFIWIALLEWREHVFFLKDRS